MKNVIFVSTLPLWSLGKGQGGPAFTQTVKKYIDEEIIYGEQKIINLRNRSYFFTENKNVLLEHKPKTIEKNQ